MNLVIVGDIDMHCGKTCLFWTLLLALVSVLYMCLLPIVLNAVKLIVLAWQFPDCTPCPWNNLI